MFLTTEQLQSYEENGLLFLPEYFSRAEVEIMKREATSLLRREAVNRVVEKSGELVRSVYGAHMNNDLFKQLSKHARTVEPAMQVLGSKTYVYQSKINAKAAFGGDIWEWHQDYIFWHKEDGMPTARVTNFIIFLDDVNEFNGPLYFIPGSHHEGMIDITSDNESLALKLNQHKPYQGSPAWLGNLTANLKYALNREIIGELVRKYGIVSPKGTAGAVLLTHANIVHGSPSNISPFDRMVAIITFNSIENLPRAVANPRPEFLASRDYTPITPLANKPLFEYA
jgi:ectoine hydroxylase-related dioxygenase (phytanoyl-CoA dioxygenase family)